MLVSKKIEAGAYLCRLFRATRIQDDAPGRAVKKPPRRRHWRHGQTGGTRRHDERENHGYHGHLGYLGCLGRCRALYSLVILAEVT